MAYIPFLFMILCSLGAKLVDAKSDGGNLMETRCMGNSTELTSALYQEYQLNVFSLVSSLTSTSSPDIPPRHLLYSDSMGKAPYKAYGYYICRGDIKPQLCHDCVVDAYGALGNQTKISQSYFPECFAFNDICMLSYSNHSIASRYIEGLVFESQAIGGKVSNYKQYNQTLSNMMVELIGEAGSSNWSTGYFTTRVVEVPESHDKIYTIVQCVPDISPVNCSKCLGELYSHLPTCCNDTQGGLVIHANCMMKFNSQSFFGGAYVGSRLRYFHIYVGVLLSVYFIFM